MDNNLSDRMEQIAKKLTPEAVSGIFFNNPITKNELIPLVKKRPETQERDGKDERKAYVDSVLQNMSVNIRQKLLIDIYKKENNGEKVDRLFGYAKNFVYYRVLDCKEEEIKRKNRYNKLKKKFDGWFGLYGYEILDKIIHKENKKIVADFIKLLAGDEKLAVEYYYSGRPSKELSEHLGISPSKLWHIRENAYKKIRRILQKKFGPDAKNILLHALSLETAIDENEIKEMIHMNFDTSEENFNYEKEDDYADMLCHTLTEIAHILPVSEMMDEYLFGRLDSVQKELFEKHLLECEKCCTEFEERKKITGILVSVIKDNNINHH